MVVSTRFFTNKNRAAHSNHRGNFQRGNTQIEIVNQGGTGDKLYSKCGINTSRFASTLAILVGGGVPLLSALASGARVMTNMILREAVEHAIERVREGTGLAHALGETHAFPPLLIHLIASGEVSGKLEQMLKRAAQLETQALERRLTVFLTLLEPVMILVMGGVVLLIVLAILLPIIQINQLVH